ncbi:MAG: hypothetical protein P4M07_19000 [Xanthobacteraceae bacterium]|nr:hypothetical protein [Xanthobacteraceae bacterium]
MTPPAARHPVDTDDNDFSLAIDRSAAKPGTWQWGIFRLGRNSPIERSRRLFKTEATAIRAGNAAFRRLMADVRA